jgi:putative oligomerization/nucleic acid binding protein
VQSTLAASVSGRLFVPMLCLCLGSLQVATGSSNKTTEIWKGLDEFVVLAPQDALTGNAVPRNDQPVVIEPANLAAALAKLRVHEGSAQEAVPLFENDAARKLAAPLSTALSRAAADQDILFAIEMLQKAAIFGSKPVSVAGRAFYQNQRLHLIIGELHISTVPPEYKNYPIGYPKPDRRLHPHQTGERSREAHYDPAAHFETGDDVSLFVQDGRLRPDWLVLNVSALAAPDQRAAATATIAPTVTSQDALPASAGTAKPSTSASPSIEERLRRLKHLREQDVITEEEYNRKRSEILDQL